MLRPHTLLVLFALSAIVVPVTAGCTIIFNMTRNASPETETEMDITGDKPAVEQENDADEQHDPLGERRADRPLN